MNIYLKGRDLTAYSADLYLSVDSGITWSLMDTSVAVEYSRRQKYSWNVPDTINSKNCYLKAIAVGDSGIERISKPGRRVYVKSEEIPKVLNGYGVAILSTSKGIITDKEARKLKVGGEILCNVW